jgi:hypothetical protein
MLAVQRLHCRYRVPGGHPDPVALQARLDRVARDRLPAQCAGLLDAVLTAGDERVVIVRRLELRLVLGSSQGDDHRIVHSWSRGIARAVARALAVEPDGELIAQFASWAHYLARFVEEVAAGTASANWCYVPFEPLRALPASATIREALCQRPDAIVPALGLLAAQDRLGWVTRVLTEPDAWTVFDAIEPGDDAARPGPPLAAPDSAVWLRPWPAGPGGCALQLLGATTPSGRAPSRRQLAAVRQVAGLLPHLDDKAVAAATGWTAALLRAAGRAGPEVLAGLRRLLADDQGAVTALLPRPAPVQRPPCPPPDEAALTAYGGVFLLLPGLAELDPACLLGRAGLDSAALGHVVPLGRWLLLLKCLGPERRPAARHDPALAAAAGLEAVPTAERLRALGMAGVPPLADLAAAVAGWMADRRLTLGRPPVAEAVELTGGPGIVLRDPHSGMWLAIDPATPDLGPPASIPPPAGADLRHLSTSGLVGDPAVDLVWSWLAALTLHLFARRLPGFARSSAAHLSRNFLAGTALFSRGDDGLTVTLPRVPLRLVLAMGGWGRHDIPWLPRQTLRIQDRVG